MYARVGGEMEGEDLELDAACMVATSSPIHCRLHQLWKVGNFHCGQPKGTHSCIKHRPESTTVVVNQPLRTEARSKQLPGINDGSQNWDAVNFCF
jgi:hypothetical protein